MRWEAAIERHHRRVVYTGTQHPSEISRNPRYHKEATCYQLKKSLGMMWPVELTETLAIYRGFRMCTHCGKSDAAEDAASGS